MKKILQQKDPKIQKSFSYRLKRDDKVQRIASSRFSPEKEFYEVSELSPEMTQIKDNITKFGFQPVTKAKYQPEIQRIQIKLPAQNSLSKYSQHTKKTSYLLFASIITKHLEKLKKREEDKMQIEQIKFKNKQGYDLDIEMSNHFQRLRIKSDAEKLSQATSQNCLSPLRSKRILSDSNSRLTDLQMDQKQDGGISPQRVQNSSRFLNVNLVQSIRGSQLLLRKSKNLAAFTHALQLDKSSSQKSFQKTQTSNNDQVLPKMTKLAPPIFDRQEVAPKIQFLGTIRRAFSPKNIEVE